MRPSASIGIFAGLFTAQGLFLPTKSALSGIDAQKSIIEGQIDSDTDESFALLQEVGSILQVDIKDMLNRSEERASALDEFTKTLKNTEILVERKLTELEALEEELNTRLREERKIARTLDRDIKKALRDQDYGKAADIEPDLAKANAAVAETDTKHTRAEDMIDRFQALLGITEKRIQALENNREILIAGIRTIDVPGLQDLGVLDTGSRWRSGRSIFGKERSSF